VHVLHRLSTSHNSVFILIEQPNVDISYNSSMLPESKESTKVRWNTYSKLHVGTTISKYILT
jgi:hypothetical protein